MSPPATKNANAVEIDLQQFLKFRTGFSHLIG